VCTALSASAWLLLSIGLPIPFVFPMTIHKISLAFLLLAHAYAAHPARPRQTALFMETNQPHGAPSPMTALSTLLLMGAHPSASFSPASVGLSAPARGLTRPGLRPSMVELTRWAEPPPRVRFAPSPTGTLHVGGAKTAMMNWLHAKKEGGKFILRMEDTDRNRSTKESEEEIMSGLKWMGFEWDEGPDIGGDHGPYRQSEALDQGLYEEKLQQLIKSNHVYRCFMTPEDIEALREEANAKNETYKVKSPWASASESEIQEMLDKDAPYVWRFRMPENERIQWKDVVLGWQRRNSSALGGDFVIMRSNGDPLYNFAASVDDARMGITHVFRAIEHVTNTPRQMLILRALRLAVPKFGHMPLLMNPDGKKLSKRDGAASVDDFGKMGISSLVLKNYLMSIGYNIGPEDNRHVVEMEEHIANFTTEKIRTGEGVFDTKRLVTYNHDYMMGWPEEYAFEKIGGQLVEDGVVKELSGVFLRKAVGLIRSRCQVLSDARKLAHNYFFDYPLKETLALEEVKDFTEDIAETAKLLLEYRKEGLLEFFKAKDQETILAGYKDIAKKVSKARKVKGKKVFFPLRILTVGVTEGPEIPETYEVLNAADDNVISEIPTLDSKLDKMEEILKTLA